MRCRRCVFVCTLMWCCRLPLAGVMASKDTREWSVVPVAGQPNGTDPGTHYSVVSRSTGRCLAVNQVNTTDSPVLLPCDASNPLEQTWAFGKGMHSPSSLYSVKTGQALAVHENTLFSDTSKYKGGNDQFPTPAASYGETNLQMVRRVDQNGCTRRGCENYDDKQMWWYDPVDSLLRQSTYTASLNHPMDGGADQSGGGNGYLTQRTPTYQHHCLAYAPIKTSCDMPCAAIDCPVNPFTCLKELANSVPVRVVPYAKHG